MSKGYKKEQRLQGETAYFPERRKKKVTTRACASRAKKLENKDRTLNASLIIAHSYV